MIAHIEIDECRQPTARPVCASGVQLNLFGMIDNHSDVRHKLTKRSHPLAFCTVRNRTRQE
jgi:hypothetical protein